MDDSGFKRWYQRNKEKLSELRKHRYQADPEYRQRAVERSRAWRRKNAERRRKAPPLYPAAYAYSFRDVADLAGIHFTTLRAWIVKGYLPAPTMFGRRYRYTAKQLELVSVIRNFFSIYGSLKGPRLPEFAEIVRKIKREW